MYGDWENICNSYQVMMMRCEVQVALESPTTKSRIETRFFSQVMFHLPKKEPILLCSDYVQLSEKTFFSALGVLIAMIPTTNSPQTLSTKMRTDLVVRG
jgi:hypothetical protein